jgi:hypothetical protein
MQCTFDRNRTVVPINDLLGELQWITERMARFRSNISGATANILDMSYKEIRINFKKSAVIGIGNGMFYCNASEVIETKISDSPTVL